MNKKRKILIVTANDYLAYQPSILNLYDFLQPFFDTTIISFEPEFIGNQKPDGRNIIYLKTPSFFKALVKKIDYFLQLSVKLFKPVFRSLSLEFSFYQRLQLFYLKLHLYKMQADEYLAVDIPALYVSQRVFGKCHFFSLELGVKDPYREKIRLENIQSVVIQNKARFNFLFQDAKLPVFYVQNAPVFDESMIKTYDRENIIWAGTILRRFAVLDCIEFVKSYPTYKLILKGGAERKTLNTINEVYKPLLESGILVIDRSYSPLDGFIDYLSHFKIGLCFYSWSLIGESINYQTAPSGKLFMYLAAGVPVIACNIPGFQFVREFGAGILIDDYRPLTIYNAVKRIEADYDSMQMACYQAARHFSFDKTVKPFIEFLLPTREFVSPLISICIPAYKNAEFLKRLLDSISIQQFRGFEVIVTDDSPDATLGDLCDRFRERFPLHYHRNSPALGTPENWNEAIRMAKGEWIKLMHDDDWFADENSLGLYADSTIAHPSASFIFSAFNNVDIRENIRHSVFIRSFRYKALCKNPVTLFSMNCIGPPSVTLYRNDRSQFYDTRLKWLVDIDFYIRCLETNKPVYIPLPLINVGISEQQVTRDLFHHRPIEIPESFALINKTGTVNLRNLLVYDAWWRLMRNLNVREKKDIEDAGYTGEIPAVILSMISWQRKLPEPLLKTGFFSKSFMFLHYLLHCNKI